MPKNKTEWLRAELDKLGLELLDIYGFKDVDHIRVKDKLTGKVSLYKSKRKIATLASVEEARALAQEIAKSIHGK